MDEFPSANSAKISKKYYTTTLDEHDDIKIRIP
jgi:hypothetical protein